MTNYKLATNGDYATKLGNVVHFNTASGKYQVMFRTPGSRMLLMSYDDRDEAIAALNAIEAMPTTRRVEVFGKA